jgi:uncharacterized membrane protein YkvA (DUF1232 family)
MASLSSNNPAESMDAFLPAKVEHEFAVRRTRVRPRDIQDVLDRADEVKQTFLNESRLARFLEEARLLLELVRDYWRGHYRQVPFYTITAVVAAMVYVISPFDLVPDFIPLIGYIDDALVFSLCLRLVRDDLQRYREWREPAE